MFACKGGVEYIIYHTALIGTRFIMIKVKRNEQRSGIKIFRVIAITNHIVRCCNLKVISVISCAVISGCFISCASNNRIPIYKEIVTVIPSDRNPIPSDSPYRYRVVRDLVQSVDSKSSTGLNDKAVELIRNGKYDDARIILEKIIGDDPEYAPAYNNLGIIYEIAGDIVNAEKNYSRACILNPDESRYVSNYHGLTGR